MRTGEIYLFDNSPAGYGDNSIILHRKIISFDNYEIFGDSKRLDDTEWDLDNPKRRSAIYNRSSRKTFERWTTKIGYAPYSEERLSMLRPDLPLRIGRIRDLSWGAELLSNEQTIKQYLKECVKLSVSNRTLDTPKLYLEGSNKNGYSQKPILITASNNEYFTVSELLYHANNIQRNIKMNKDYKSEGIGIYRTGIKNGIPIYYIWGYYDLADHLRAYEIEGVDISEA